MKHEKEGKKVGYYVWKWCHSSLGYGCGYYSTTQIVGFDFARKSPLDLGNASLCIRRSNN
jgi:hypothetical protein